MHIPQYFEFVNSAKLLSGEYALENIREELSLLGSTRPFLLSDKGLESVGSVKTLLDILSSSGLKVSGVFTDIPLDSSILKVNEIASLYRKENADGIIALGGGSVIDTAKGLRMLISQGGKDILKYAGAEVLPRGMSVPFVAIPTTSGTGSEATGVAVIKDEEKEVKLEFISSFLLPDIAVLDVRMLESMPKRITAITGIDALTHAIEAFSSLQKNPVSQSYAIAAMKMIVENLPTAIREPKNKKARLAMANAAYIAGAAFSNSMVGIVHAIGHSVGAVSHVPHGEAMSILLIPSMRYNIDYAREDYSEMLLYINGEEYARTREENRAEKLIEVLSTFVNEIRSLAPVRKNLSEAGVVKEDFQKIADRAINDGALIVNPRSADRDDILRILSEAF